METAKNTYEVQKTVSDNHQLKLQQQIPQDIFHLPSSLGVLAHRSFQEPECMEADNMALSMDLATT